MTLQLPATETSDLLVSALQRFLADNPRPTWQGLADELGLMGIGIPEEQGGTGGGAIERALVAAELAPAMAAADWLSHVTAAALLARIAQNHALLSDLASGAQRIALALDAPTLVAGGALADWLLLAEPDGIRLIPAGAAERRTRPMFDSTETADFTLPARAGEQLTAEPEAYHWARHALFAGRCAEAAGLMARMHKDTAEYLNQRHQFGQPIARFQVLRHRMADMHMALLKAAALTERAVLAEDTPSASHALSAALVETIDAVRTVGEGAVQLHGGMGVTEELELGTLFKRGLTIASTLGPRTAHLARHAETLA